MILCSQRRKKNDDDYARFMVIFFIRMPAGLNIYMFVSTLFGFIQQHYFINEKTKDNKAKVVALN